MVEEPRPQIVVSMEGVGRSYAGSPQVEALKPSSLTIRAGDHVSVVGPSGSGKSTLLSIIGFLDRPTTGRYEFVGLDTSGLSESERTRLRGSAIGFVFQSFHLLAHRSALENVEMGLMYNGIRRSRRRQLARDALGRIGMAHRQHFSPLHLSGGERQRVAIARAMAIQPQLLLCDEPTGNLDTSTADDVLKVIASLNGEGVTTVVVTHDPYVASCGKRTIEIVDGSVEEIVQLRPTWR